MTVWPLYSSHVGGAGAPRKPGHARLGAPCVWPGASSHDRPLRDRTLLVAVPVRRRRPSDAARAVADVARGPVETPPPIPRRRRDRRAGHGAGPRLYLRVGDDDDPDR